MLLLSCQKEERCLFADGYLGRRCKSRREIRFTEMVPILGVFKVKRRKKLVEEVGEIIELYLHRMEEWKLNDTIMIFTDKLLLSNF